MSSVLDRDSGKLRRWLTSVLTDAILGSSGVPRVPTEYPNKVTTIGDSADQIIRGGKDDTRFSERHASSLEIRRR